jgi:hypothetical protein
VSETRKEQESAIKLNAPSSATIGAKIGPVWGFADAAGNFSHGALL